MGVVAMEGSPPLTRGTRIEDLKYSLQSRITPAYAGNTPAIKEVYRPLRDHPRLRGEHEFKEIQVIGKVGSPPLTRGTRIHYG